MNYLHFLSTSLQITEKKTKNYKIYVLSNSKVEFQFLKIT